MSTFVVVLAEKPIWYLRGDVPNQGDLLELPNGEKYLVQQVRRTYSAGQLGHNARQDEAKILVSRA